MNTGQGDERGVIRCPECLGQGCDDCIGRGMLWSDGARMTVCPKAKEPGDYCVRRTAVCPSCLRPARLIPTTMDLKAERDLWWKLRTAMKEGEA